MSLQVSMAVVHEAFNLTANNLPAQKPPSSASKKDKSTDRDKVKGKKAKDIQPVGCFILLFSFRNVMSFLT